MAAGVPIRQPLHVERPAARAEARRGVGLPPRPRWAAAARPLQGASTAACGYKPQQPSTVALIVGAAAAAAVSTDCRAFRRRRLLLRRRRWHRAAAISETSPGKAFSTAEEEDDFYFGVYGRLSNHLDMLEDTVRTMSFRRAIMDSCEGKVVLDIGCGTGILSLFAAQAGATHVIAVEASGKAAACARRVIAHNGFADRITVLAGRVEDVADEIEDALLGARLGREATADVLISEWMGYVLVHENMFPTVALARDRWLAADGRMLPAECTLCAAPFSGKHIARELRAFWRSKLYGIDLSPLAGVAMQEVVSRPVIGCLQEEHLLADPAELWRMDCGTATAEDVASKSTAFDFSIARDGPFHGLVLWFTCRLFESVGFTTGPEGVPTHWEQALLFAGAAGKGAQRGPKKVSRGDRLLGTVSWEELGRGVKLGMAGEALPAGDDEAGVEFSSHFDWHLRSR